MRCEMERDEDIMMREQNRKCRDSVFGYSGRRRNGNCGIRILNFYFCFVGVEESATRTGEVHNLPMGSIFAINRFQICDLDLDKDGLALSLCVSAETIASFHIKLLKCEVKCQSFFYMEDQQEKI